MCEVPEDTSLTKVSMRTNERVVERGIDLQQALSDASAEYGGGGGDTRSRRRVYPENGRTGVRESCQQDTRRTVHCGGSRSSLTTSSAGDRPGLFPEGCAFILSTTGRIRQVLYEGARLATVRASDGRLTLGIGGQNGCRPCFPPLPTGWLSGTMLRSLSQKAGMHLQNTWSQRTPASAPVMTCSWLPAETA